MAFQFKFDLPIRDLAAVAFGFLVLATGASVDLLILLVSSWGLSLVVSSCEASSTHHIPPCTLSENLLHKLHAIRVAASTIPLLRLAAEVNLLERKFMARAIARVTIVFDQWGLASVSYPLVLVDVSKDHNLVTIALKIRRAMLDPTLFHAI